MKTKSMFFRRIINVIELICLSVIISPILVKGNFFRGEKEISDHAGITKSVLTYQEIVGGTVAEEGEFPWFAAFEPLVQCGGSLIAPNRILTAAHCIGNYAPAAVRIGPTILDNGEQKCVRCAVKHPDFFSDSDGDFYNDVAVIKLEGSSNVKPIKLNNNTNYPSQRLTPLTVIGYGATSEGGETSDRLKKLNTFFETIENCQKNYPDVRKGVQLCADVENEGDCQGDSGGPLFDVDETQVGIVSYGIGCAQAPEDVYADVSGYYDWIQAQIEDDTCEVFPDPDDDTCTKCLCFFERICCFCEWLFQTCLPSLFGWVY